MTPSRDPALRPAPTPLWLVRSPSSASGCPALARTSVSFPAGDTDHDEAIITTTVHWSAADATRGRGTTLARAFGAALAEANSPFATPPHPNVDVINVVLAAFGLNVKAQARSGLQLQMRKEGLFVGTQHFADRRSDGDSGRLNLTALGRLIGNPHPLDALRALRCSLEQESQTCTTPSGMPLTAKWHAVRQSQYLELTHDSESEILINIHDGNTWLEMQGLFWLYSL